MSVAQFPTPANSAHPSEAVTGPPWLKLEELPPEYPGIVFKQMGDGGGVYGGDTVNKVRRFRLTYGGLTAAQAKQLDDHRATAFDTLLGFDYRFWRVTDATVDELLTDVHYETYEASHDKTWSESRVVTLVKRPA